MRVSLVLPASLYRLTRKMFIHNLLMPLIFAKSGQREDEISSPDNNLL
ncbi:hypothetical protein FRUB_07828 [Fimbriiglobus ruber]|uniref:Uncharacterized protein n=1 Tax=Fimbriiglobus ruber TaxID=1908690 RepID=A0A225DJD6_9BACT|nr:hypothetical protein FRUB_07828 [Fimbriiglobus ruber]